MPALDARVLRHCHLAHTRNLAHNLASIAEQGDCLLLKGDLGAGKTHFANAYIDALCDVAVVTSPTFTIGTCYTMTRSPLTGRALWHYDLYRLRHEEEIEETGLEESLQSGITLIEWPEIAEFFLPATALHITFAFDRQPDYRDITIRGDAVWRSRLTQIRMP